jgi:hypothetical protein
MEANHVQARCHAVAGFISPIPNQLMRACGLSVLEERYNLAAKDIENADSDARLG